MAEDNNKAEKKRTATEAYDQLEKTVTDRMAGIEGKIGTLQQSLEDIKGLSEDIQGFREDFKGMATHSNDEECPECGFKRDKPPQPPEPPKEPTEEEPTSRVKVKIIDK